jgi:hypothetical protein
VIYDAGSSGTRLYVYEKQGDDWLEHAGPKVSALADPVREIRGKSWQDADAVTDEVVAALDDIKQDGEQWQAFDWSQHCAVQATKVFATAGMRIAEQENRERSAALWNLLQAKLAAKVGTSVTIQTRTLSGYEEGLYAWLAVREKQQNNDFGIVEMGGASSQITFACPDCDTSNDAVRTIVLEDQPLQVYSYSFLGLGQDEAPNSLGFPQACAYGVGMQQKDWKVNACASQMKLQTAQGIFDPYNFGQQKRGAYNQIPAQQSKIETWFLTGAFNYMSADKIDTCCLNKGKCYNAEKSCFQAVYLGKYLDTLQVPAESTKQDVSWTRGALICAVNDCLQQAKTPVCRWSAEGCL